MEIFLEFDPLVLHQGNPQTAGRNIQQHQAFIAGDLLVPHCFADGHVLGINFHGHFRYGYIQPGPQFDLVKHEHFVAGFPDRRGSLGRIHIRSVALHQFFKALQHLADFFHHGKGNAFIFKSFFPQPDWVIALFNDLDPVQAAVFHNAKTQHLRAQMDGGQRCIRFTFHKNSP